MTKNAWEARRFATEAQFDLAMKAIETEMSHGEKFAELNFVSELEEEVVEKLNDLGYDILYYNCIDKSKSYVEVSWEYAEPNREGEVYIFVEYEPGELMYVPEEEFDNIFNICDLSEGIEFSFEGYEDGNESFNCNFSFEPIKRNLFNFEQNDESEE